MSVAVRKKSWEDHVSQWIGSSLNTSGCDKLCCHGIKVEHLKTAMEEHGKGDTKETSSLSESIYLEDCNGFCEDQEQVSKDIDENENLGTDHCVSLNTSIETFIFLPSKESELKTTNEDLLPNQDRISSLVKTLLENDVSNTSEVSDISHDVEENKCPEVEGGDTKYKIKEDNVNVLDGMSSDEMLHGNTDLEEIDMSGEQLLHSARIAQQRRKSDGSKVVYEQNICSAVSTDPSESLHFCVSSHLEPEGGTGGFQYGSSLCRDTDSHNDANSDFNESQDGLQQTNPTNCTQSVPSKDNMSTCEVICDQVRLRRKKVRLFLYIYIYEILNYEISLCCNN